MKHIAFNSELPPGDAPEWVQLLPAGPDVTGVDGRSWIFDAEAKELVLAAFPRRGRPLVIDWEHATELRAPNGEEAPAAAWMHELALRSGELWARVEWTTRAAAQVSNREYRYLSPVFNYHKSTGRVLEIVSAGLTNSPNLRLQALNREAEAHLNEEDDMPLKPIAKVLSLDDGATADQIVTAINSLKADAKKAPTVPVAVCRALGLAEGVGEDGVVLAVNSLKTQTLDMTKVVPRADYDQAMNRAQTAETELKKQAAAKAEGEITSLVDQAVTDGKVAPASKDFYLAACRQEGGVENFKKFLASAPVLVKEREEARQVDASGTPKLTDVELGMCTTLGLDPKDYAKTLGKEVK